MAKEDATTDDSNRENRFTWRRRDIRVIRKSDAKPEKNQKESK